MRKACMKIIQYQPHSPGRANNNNADNDNGIKKLHWV